MNDKIHDQVARRFGAAVKSGRARAGLTQHQVEDRTGVSRPALARYERGETVPRLDDALILAERLGFSLDELA